MRSCAKRHGRVWEPLIASHSLGTSPQGEKWVPHGIGRKSEYIHASDVQPLRTNRNRLDPDALIILAQRQDIAVQPIEHVCVGVRQANHQRSAPRAPSSGQLAESWPEWATLARRA